MEEISQDERKKIREEERRKIMKEMKREKCNQKINKIKKKIQTETEEICQKQNII